MADLSEIKEHDVVNLTGKTFLHYTIKDQIGQGGMGVVYLAEDMKLKRQVAIKFLPRHIASNNDERKRFEIEAQAAALNHPNISHIYAIEEFDEEMFIVMEYIEGKELRELIIDNCQLSIENCIDYATQIASGLQAAHDKGIVHRDIKSSNIMITEDGKVKIMDFGLAKVESGIQLTKDQSTLGTAPYMSPEQIRGNEVDQRSDIWSFGVVLYEMVTGTLPFKGNYEQAVIYSILNEEPDFNSIDLPDILKEILQKSLQKNLQDRYGTMTEILEELKIKSNGSVVKDPSIAEKKYGAQIPSTKKILPVIAVILIGLVLSLWFFLKPETLPEGRIPIAVVDFENLSGEPELNALSGMLITALEQSNRLSVLTRSRMFDVLRQIGKKDVSQIDEKLGSEICQKLQVHALIISTIRKFGKNYTIDLKLIDPINDEYLFTAKEEVEGQEQIPSMIDRISDKTREGLKEKEADLIQTNQRVDAVTTTNLEAYQHYFKGMEYFDREQYRDAEEEFKKSVNLDSSFGLAFYRLAVTKYRRGGGNIQKLENLIKKSMDLIESVPEREKYLIQARYKWIKENYKEAISILLEMEKKYNDDKEMSTMLARYAFQDRNYQLALKYFEKVVKLDPEYEMAWTNWGGSLPAAYIMTGELEDGLAKLIQLELQYPNLSIIGKNIADFYSYLDRYEEAEQEYENVLKKDQPLKSKIDNSYNRAFFLPYRGKYKEALKAFDNSINLAKQAGDSSAIASMLTFKSILFVWGWNDIENAKIVARQADVYQNNLIYSLAHRLLFFYQENYDKVLEIAGATESTGQLTITNRLIQGRKGNCEPLENTENLWQTRDQLDILMLYHLAECQFHNSQFNKAIETIKGLQKIYNNTAGFRAVYYPKSFYLSGKIYEKLSNREQAGKSYKKFLKLWKDADQDLPDLIDAKKHLAALKQVSVK